MRFRNKVAVVTGAGGRAPFVETDAASDASWISAQILAVDGGQVMRV